MFLHRRISVISPADADEKKILPSWVREHLTIDNCNGNSCSTYVNCSSLRFRNYPYFGMMKDPRHEIPALSGVASNQNPERGETANHCHHGKR